MADFLNRTNAADSDDVIAEEPLGEPPRDAQAAGEAARTLPKTKNAKRDDLPVASSAIASVGAAPKKSKSPTERKAKSAITSKPEIDPAEKLRQREAQIQEAELTAKHEAELTAKPDAATRRETQARELLQGITELDAFRDATDKWARGESICWEGAWLGAVAPMAAGAVQRFRRPILVVLAQHQDAETVARDLDFF